MLTMASPLFGPHAPWLKVEKQMSSSFHVPHAYWHKEGGFVDVIYSLIKAASHLNTHTAQVEIASSLMSIDLDTLSIGKLLSSNHRKWSLCSSGKLSALVE